MTDYFHLNLPREELLNLSSLGLAHLGDSVFEVMVRSWLCLHGKVKPKDLHRATVSYVAAPAQAARVQRILPLLTQEEQDVFRRGRNANVNTIPHHASRAQYATATALEALLGWLYLRGDKERVNELFCEMMKVEG
jgi:ribonuclease-3 family protein